MPSETEYTTITVEKSVKEDLDEYRNEQPWGVFLEELRREHADPITLNDAQEIADTVKNELSMANDPGTEVDVAGLYDEIDRLKELIERVPDETAEKIGGRYK